MCYYDIEYKYKAVGITRKPPFPAAFVFGDDFMNKDNHKCKGCTWGTRTGDKYFCMIPGPKCWKKVT